MQNRPLGGLIDRYAPQEGSYDGLPFFGLPSIENRSKTLYGGHQFVHDAV